MKLGIMQPYLFPYIGYYQLMHAVDRFVIADDLTFIKQGWINRNRLLVNGKAAYFTVPLRHHRADALIRDIEIDDGLGKRWRRIMLKTVENFYRRAPFFDGAYPIVEMVIGGSFSRIADMARSSLRGVFDYLGVPVSLVESSAIYGNAHLRGQERIIDTCISEKATDYVNAIGGRELYSREAFLARGIRLHFVSTEAIEYPQFKSPFVASLSIIDLLMFNSPDRTRQLLERYELL
jgi:hypothetical protein